MIAISRLFRTMTRVVSYLDPGDICLRCILSRWNNFSDRKWHLYFTEAKSETEANTLHVSSLQGKENVTSR